MRSITPATIALLALVFPLHAVAPQFWTVDTPEDFLAGEIEGLVVTARGTLQAGPQMSRVATVDDPFVLSQVLGENGARFLGTGNEGKVYRLSGKDLQLLYTAPEPEIYAMAFSRGALYVASSPNGRIYRVDPRSGAATEFYDPKEAFIWAIAVLPDGSMAVATGVDGRLHRVQPNGQGRIWFDAPETHLRSLAHGPGGKLLAGGSGEGRIYEIGEGGGRALYDSALPEISTIVFDGKTGEAYAAAVTNVLPTVAPAKAETKVTATSAAQQGTGEKQQQQQQSSASADVSFSFGGFGASTGAVPGGSAELYRISRDGYVEQVRKLEREMIYALSPGPDGSLYIATGPQGRIYRYAGGEFSLIASVPEKQLVSLNNDGGAVFATTTNTGAVYRITNGNGGKGEFRSSVRDTARFSTFGTFRATGSSPANTASIAFRSGNTGTPDETWSAWSTPIPATTGRVSAPPARYIQMKISGSGDLSLDSVSVAYVNRNAAPSIDSVTVAEPAVVYLAGNYPVAPQVVEATNPDEFGIFTSLDESADRSAPGKKYFRRGYRTVSWKASDPNGDLLRYDLKFRRLGSGEWLRLRDNIEETQLNFDTSQLPDGRYEIRLVASDGRSNPEAALTDAHEGVELLVDNTAPRITSSVEGSDIRIRVSDELSPIAKAEYSVDAQKWIPLIPEDGIADGTEESFRIPATSVDGKFVVVRALDVFYNVATATVR